MYKIGLNLTPLNVKINTSSDKVFFFFFFKKEKITKNPRTPESLKKKKKFTSELLLQALCAVDVSLNVTLEFEICFCFLNFKTFLFIL